MPEETLRQHIVNLGQQIQTLSADTKCQGKELAALKSDTQTQAREIVELKKLYNVMNSMATNLAVITAEITNIKDTVDTVKTDVNTIKQKPAVESQYYKRIIIGTVLAAIATAIISAVLVTMTRGC